MIQLQELTQQLQINSYIGNLADGSSNILELIRDGYNVRYMQILPALILLVLSQSLAQSVSLSVPSLPGVNITVHPRCDK